MDLIYLPLVVDENKQALNVEKQLAVALVRATGRDLKIKAAQVLGWPITLIKNEKNGGYLIFDQTLSLETKFHFTILQEYDKILTTLQNSKNESEILSLLKSFKWYLTKGVEEVSFRGLVDTDLTPLFLTGSPQIPLSLMQIEATQFDLDMLLQDLNSRENQILNNVSAIEEVISKVTTIVTILKGKRAEERKQIEDKYDQLISAKNEELKQKVVELKKQLEGELSNEAKKLYGKLAEIEVLIAKSELDKEAGFVTDKDVEALNVMKSKYINELNSSITSIKNKYKIEVQKIVNEINLLNQQKQKEIEVVNSKIAELDNILQSVTNQLNSVKNSCEQELNALRSVYKRAPYNNEKIDIVIPFLVVKDYTDRVFVVGPQVYKYKKSFIRFFRKEPYDISEDLLNLSNFASALSYKYSQTISDNLKQIRQLVEKGLEELYEDGWNIRRRVEEYYV